MQQHPVQDQTPQVQDLADARDLEDLQEDEFLHYAEFDELDERREQWLDSHMAGTPLTVREVRVEIDWITVQQENTPLFIGRDLTDEELDQIVEMYRAVMRDLQALGIYIHPADWWGNRLTDAYNGGNAIECILEIWNNYFENPPSICSYPALTADMKLHSIMAPDSHEDYHREHLDVRTWQEWNRSVFDHSEMMQ